MGAKAADAQTAALISCLLVNIAGTPPSGVVGQADASIKVSNPLAPRRIVREEPAAWSASAILF
jgi:hypothetical protein